MGMACLVDTTRCTGCRACQVACKQWNDLAAEKTEIRGGQAGYGNPPALSSKTFTKMEFHEILGPGGDLQRSVFVKHQCMHCLEPSCVSACPVAALGKTDSGAVVYDGHKCIGCRYCMLACPFGVPTLQWDRLAAYIKKCTFCFDRLADAPMVERVNDKPLGGESLARMRHSQQIPACVKACPTGCIIFGDRDELIAEAHRRIEQQNVPGSSWKYVDHVYREKEVGGTAWLYITNVPFEELGFRTDLGERPYPEYTELALDSVPVLAMAVGAALGGAYWFTRRRNDVAQAEGPRTTAEE